MVKFKYRNHKGVISERQIEPTELEWIVNPGYDYQPGWFLSGNDYDKDGARRSFALSHVILEGDAVERGMQVRFFRLLTHKDFDI